MEGKLSPLFNEIYKSKGWGDNQTPYYSGIGSHIPSIINPYIGVVKSFFKNLDYKPNVIDIGCGDFNVGSQLVNYTNNYLAVDVVDSLIEYNKVKYKDLNVEFKNLDITKGSIPFSDVIMVRQVFQHLSNSNILEALKNIYLKSKYIILTEVVPLGNFTPNLDINFGASTRPMINNSGIEITSPPFDFPIEEELITLSIKEKGIINNLVKTTIYKTKNNG